MHREGSRKELDGDNGSVAPPGNDEESGEGEAGDDKLTVPLINTNMMQGKSNMLQMVMNLTQMFMGTGLVGLPFAIASLGYVMGSFLIAFVLVHTYIELWILIRSCHETGSRTYTDLMKNELGVCMKLVMQLSLVFATIGGLVSSLVVIGDILVGTRVSGYHGVLTDLARDHSGEVWYLSRWFVLLVLCVFLLQPLVLQKRWHHLAGSSAISVVFATAFGALMIMLVSVASSKNVLAGLQPWINTSLDDSSVTKNCAANVFLHSWGIYLYSYEGSFNLPSLMEELKDYNIKRLSRAFWLSYGLASAIFAVVAVMAAMLFGEHTHGDVLTNLNVASLSDFLSPCLAGMSFYGLVSAYGIVILASYPTINFCFRENASYLLFGSSRVEGFRFYLVTYVPLIVAYLLALYVRSVHVVLGFVGSALGATNAFIVPALLAFRRKYGCGKGKVIAVVYGILGVVVAFHGTIGHGWQLIFKTPIYC